MPGGARRSTPSTGEQIYARADPLVAELAAVRDGVISIAQLRRCGLHDKAVAVRVRAGTLHRIHRGVYAVGHPGISLRGRFRAAVLAAGAGTALGRFSAAADWGFMAWKEGEPEVIATVAASRGTTTSSFARTTPTSRRFSKPPATGSCA